LVERSYRGINRISEDSSPRDEADSNEPVEQIIPNVKLCTQCKGSFNKGVEIVVVNSVSGYKGTFCSSECRREWVKLNDKGHVE
jgi:hypothetical protein